LNAVCSPSRQLAPACTHSGADHPSNFAAASQVAGRLGVNPETLRLSKKRADVDTDREARMTSEAQLDIKRLKK